MNVKIRQIIFVIFIIFLFTGCTATADINVNYEGTVTESIDIVAPNSNIKYGDKSIKDSIELLLRKYDIALKVGKYNTDPKIGENNSGAKITRNYDDICLFVTKTIFSQYVYQKFECLENDYYYEIKSVGSLAKNTDRYDSWLAPDNINIKITLPIAAEENNADSVNGNTYVWEYGKDAPDGKNFYLKINKAALKENEEKYNEDQKRKNTLKNIVIIGITLGIFIILFVIGRILYKKYQSNKLDY